LTKILGVYQVRIKKQAPVIFFITENMIGQDFHRIKHCWDLKGATYGRKTEVTDEEQAEQKTGMNVLKD
jgi:hypothetical protein